MRRRADFHKLEFIFSLGITPDMLSSLTLDWKIFNFCCMVLKCQFRFNNKWNITSLRGKYLEIFLCGVLFCVRSAEFTVKEWTVSILYSELWISVDVLNVDLSSLSEVILGHLAVTVIQVTTMLVPFDHQLCQLSLLLRSLASDALLLRCHQCVT